MSSLGPRRQEIAFVRRFVSAAAAAMLALPSAPSASATMSTPLVLTLLRPDGTPASDAVAVAQVFDGVTASPTGFRPVYEARASAGGVVTVQIPMDDPYIAAHYPAQRIYNIYVSLFTFNGDDRSRPTLFSAVNYILNLGDPEYPVDFADVNGRVIDLVGVPEFPLAMAAAGAVPNSNNCTYTTANPPPVYACQVVTHPTSMQSEYVVVAHNVGAGIDMATEFTIENNLKLSTSTVVGIDGLFVESRGAHTLVNDSQVRFNYNSAGINAPDEDAVALTDMAQVDNYVCWGGPSCTRTTTTVPDVVHGGLGSPQPTSEVRYHDFAQNPGPTNTDCTIGINDYFLNGQGVNKQESWTFGFDFEGQFKALTLHANAVIENVTAVEGVNAYVWKVTGHTKKYHHVFVPFGRLGSEESSLGSSCPDNSPGSVWTDASDTNKEPSPLPPELTVGAAPGVQERVKDDREKVSRCRAAPERCGQDW